MAEHGEHKKYISPEKQKALKESKRVLKYKQRERQVRKGRMWQERLRTFFRFMFVLGLIGAMAYIVKLPQWYLSKTAFTAVGSGSVEILNNNIVPSYRILAVLRSSPVPDKPIYMAKTRQIRDIIRKLTPVEDVYIRRYAFPARLQIIVRERVPSMMISPDIKVAPVAFFTTDGKLIGKEYLPLKKSYNTLLVLSYGNKGDDYRKWDLNKIKQIEKIEKYIETYSGEKVEYIDFRNPNDVYVKIKTVPIRLGRIDETVFDRIERIPAILPQVKIVDSKVKYLDLSWEKVNYLKLQ